MIYTEYLLGHKSDNFSDKAVWYSLSFLWICFFMASTLFSFMVIFSGYNSFHPTLSMSLPGSVLQCKLFDFPSPPLKATTMHIFLGRNVHFGSCSGSCFSYGFP